MLYLLDANVLIDANRDYYPIDRVPEFWSWLGYQGELGHAKIPIEIVEEVKDGNDLLADWIKESNIQSCLHLDESAFPENVTFAVHNGYAPDLTDEEQLRLGRDPFLISYAVNCDESRCIVTTEGRKPSKQRANRKIPDVCDALGIPTCSPFEFNRTLNFSTGWSRP